MKMILKIAESRSSWLRNRMFMCSPFSDMLHTRTHFGGIYYCRFYSGPIKSISFTSFGSFGSISGVHP